MAITGYDDTYVPEDTRNYDYAASLVGILGNNHSEVLANIQLLRDAILQYGPYESVIDAEGRIDLTKIERFPFYSEMDTDVVYYGDGEFPVAVTYIEGQKTVLFGSYATRYIQQMSIPSQRELITPIIKIASVGPYQASLPEGGGSTGVLNFAASFNTRYGETQLSNIVMFGPVLRWTTIELELDDTAIPEYATGINFYRFFGSVTSGGAFRLIHEAKF